MTHDTSPSSATPAADTPPERQIDIAIIGGGPTGLTAALYAGRALRRTVLWEREMIGGQIATTGTVENYPGFPQGINGFDLAMAMHEQAERFGTETKYGAVTAIRHEPPHYVLTAEDGEYRAKAVIMTAGAAPNKLQVPGEAEFVGKGVSYCATCDAAFFQDQVVAVVGGGDAAIDEALFTTRYASHVYVIHRRDQLRASAVLQQRAFAEPKIEFVWNSEVARVNGDDSVQSLTLRDAATGAERALEVRGLFVFIGQRPNSEVMGTLVPLDGGGHAYVNLWMETEQPGLFVAGDVRVEAPRQVVTAAGDGATAAIRADRYLSEHFGEPSPGD